MVRIGRSETGRHIVRQRNPRKGAGMTPEELEKKAVRFVMKFYSIDCELACKHYKDEIYSYVQFFKWMEKQTEGQS